MEIIKDYGTEVKVKVNGTLFTYRKSDGWISWMSDWDKAAEFEKNGMFFHKHMKTAWSATLYFVKLK